MAQKQDNDSAVNTQDNEEWMKTEAPMTPVQHPVSPVQPPVTPVIVVKQQELLPSAQPIYVPSPDVVFSKQQNRSRQVNIYLLLFASYFVAYVAFWNVTELIFVYRSKVSAVDITFNVLKTTVGLCGAYLLAIKELTAIKAYAATWFLVYACGTSFFLYHAFAHRQELTADACVQNDFWDHTHYAQCVDRVWFGYMQWGIGMILYTLFGYLVTFGYACRAIQFESVQKAPTTGEESRTDVL